MGRGQKTRALGGGTPSSSEGARREGCGEMPPKGPPSAPGWGRVLGRGSQPLPVSAAAQHRAEHGPRWEGTQVVLETRHHGRGNSEPRDRGTGDAGGSPQPRSVLSWLPEDGRLGPCSPPLLRRACGARESKETAVPASWPGRQAVTAGSPPQGASGPRAGCQQASTLQGSGHVSGDRPWGQGVEPRQGQQGGQLRTAVTLEGTRGPAVRRGHHPRNGESGRQRRSGNEETPRTGTWRQQQNVGGSGGRTSPRTANAQAAGGRGAQGEGVRARGSPGRIGAGGNRRQVSPKKQEKKVSWNRRCVQVRSAGLRSAPAWLRHSERP